MARDPDEPGDSRATMLLPPVSRGHATGDPAGIGPYSPDDREGLAMSRGEVKFLVTVETGELRVVLPNHTVLSFDSYRSGDYYVTKLDSEGQKQLIKNLVSQL